MSTILILPLLTSTNHVNDQSINHITTTVNHLTPIRNQTINNQPVINAPDHSTPIRNRIRRRNIQLYTNAVINLSTVTLSQDENQLLARGLSFCPTPRNINWTEVRADFHEFSRRMRLLEYFHDYPPQTNLNPFRTKSNWTPPPHRDPALDTFLDVVEHDLLKLKPAPVRDNLTTRERHACKMLSRRSDIVIKSADKGSGTVVMDRDWYINDTKFYKLLDNDVTTDTQKRILKYTERMNRDKIINEETKRYLIQTDPKPGRFYILPKVHKHAG